MLPVPAGVRFQALHSLDAADAYRLAIVRDVRGAFNVAADPVVGGGGGTSRGRRVVAPPPGARAVPLAPDTAAGRLDEIATGVGARDRQS